MLYIHAFKFIHIYKENNQDYLKIIDIKETYAYTKTHSVLFSTHVVYLMSIMFYKINLINNLRHLPFVVGCRFVHQKQKNRELIGVYIM